MTDEKKKWTVIRLTPTESWLGIEAETLEEAIALTRETKSDVQGTAIEDVKESFMARPENEMEGWLIEDQPQEFDLHLNYEAMLDDSYDDVEPSGPDTPDVGDTPRQDRDIFDPGLFSLFMRAINQQEQVKSLEDMLQTMRSMVGDWMAFSIPRLKEDQQYDLRELVKGREASSWLALAAVIRKAGVGADVFCSALPLALAIISGEDPIRLIEFMNDWASEIDTGK